MFYLITPHVLFLLCASKNREKVNDNVAQAIRARFLEQFSEEVLRKENLWHSLVYVYGTVKHHQKVFFYKLIKTLLEVHNLIKKHEITHI